MIRALIVVVVAAVVAFVQASVPPASSSGSDRPLVSGVGAIGMTVGNAERSAAFYADVLGFQKVTEADVRGEPYERLQAVPGLRTRVVRMRLGDETIELTEYLTPRGRPIPADSRSHDRWFQHIAIVVSDMDRAYGWLRARGVEHISPEPQRLPDWNPNAGGIRAFYFKDPDGRPLEIIWFPSGKGDVRWQRPDGRLFLGIDHTAIVVGNTGRSLACYRDALGLAIAGRSENWGPEQERLNDVAGARLQITTLRASTGPGIELLEYLTPRDGRPAPRDARANDLAHWQPALLTDDATAAARALRGGACAPVSDAVATPDRALGFARGALARDPDGHAFTVIEAR